MRKYIKMLGCWVVAIILVYQFLTISKLKVRLMSVEQGQAMINGQIGDMESSVAITLNEELEKSRIVKDIEFKYREMDEEGYVVDIEMDLKANTKGSPVYLMTKAGNSESWEKIKMDEVDTLSYKGTLNYNKNLEYKYKVVTDGNTQESGDVEVLSKYSFIPTAPDVMSVGREAGEKDYHSIIISVMCPNENYEEYGSYYRDEDSEKLDNINNIKVKRVEFIVANKSQNYTYKADRQVETMEIEYENSYERIYHEVKIPNSKYNYKVDNIKVKITYENGLEDIIDITNRVRSDLSSL